MTVSKICCRSVDSASGEDSALIAAKRMQSRNVGTLVVLDKKQRPIGLVTDRDLTLRVLAEGLDAATTSVRDVMTSGVKTISEECPIEEALEIMREGPFRRIPVVNGRDQLTGIVSVDDVIHPLADEFRSIGDLLNAESPAQLGR